jgi:hypothetical protein
MSFMVTQSMMLLLKLLGQCRSKSTEA